jgi:hypothetical protein
MYSNFGGNQNPDGIKANSQLGWIIFTLWISNFLLRMVTFIYMIYLMKKNTYAAYMDLKYKLIIYCISDTFTYIIN